MSGIGGQEFLLLCLIGLLILGPERLPRLQKVLAHAGAVVERVPADLCATHS